MTDDDTRLRAFVIMPFDSEFDAVYEALIAKPLEEAGFCVNRADDVDSRQNVLADVVHGIANADLVVADLTTNNANVFYELGLAHAMNVPTVLVAHHDSSEEIPFDLRQYRTEFYDTHFQRASAITDAMRDLGHKHAEGKVEFGSPVSDHLPTLGKPRIRAIRTVPASHGGPSEEKPTDDRQTTDQDGKADDRGLLEYNDEVITASDEFGEIAGRFSDATAKHTDQVVRLSEEMGKLDGASPRGQTQARGLVLRTAELLDSYFRA